MATCPRCLGPLTDDHRCTRHAYKRVVDGISTVAAGAVTGTVVCFAIADRPVTAVVLAAAALGAVLAFAFRQAVGGRI
jgi:small-conductance mechanosensitive channel